MNDSGKGRCINCDRDICILASGIDTLVHEIEAYNTKTNEEKVMLFYQMFLHLYFPLNISENFLLHLKEAVKFKINFNDSVMLLVNFCFRYNNNYEGYRVFVTSFFESNSEMATPYVIEVYGYILAEFRTWYLTK